MCVAYIIVCLNASIGLNRLCADAAQRLPRRLPQHTGKSPSAAMISTETHADRQTDRQTSSFIEYSTEAGILLRTHTDKNMHNNKNLNINFNPVDYT
jgi:hypothetical protein